MNTDLQANDIAANFASQMAAFLTPAQADELSDKNAALGNDHGICHSHDYCDANEAMECAFRTVMARDFDMQSDADCRLWEEAFARFRFHGSRVGRALFARGLRLEHQGGGMFNWRKPATAEDAAIFGKKLHPAPCELYCGDDDGQEPTDTAPCFFGLMLEASDTLASKEFATGRELAAFLAK